MAETATKMDMSNANTLEKPSASASQLAAELKELISLPDVYLRLQQVMRSDEASMNKVAEVLTLDPALVARLLRIANSALYSFPSRVDTVTRAINILGLHQVHDLVLATSVAKAFAGMDNAVLDMRTFWYRSVQCGILARTLAEGAGMEGGESLFVRGLLYDLGHLVLYHHYPEQCRAALAESGGEYGVLTQAERRRIGCDATMLTAELMRTWQLPAIFAQSYDYLDDPQHAPEQRREIAILHIATAITRGLDTDLLLEEIVERIPARIWKLVELPPEVATHAMDAATLELIDAMYRVLAGGD